MGKFSQYVRGVATAVALTTAAASAQAAETTKIGVLHSLSGTMAISETTLKDTVLMMIDNLNKEGGLLGRKVEAVVVDPASNWPLFAEKARELIEKSKVDVVFGCWTSVSRKSVLPVFEELNSLLFYPVQYEGEESSQNVFYTGAAPNQQAIPAVDYLMNEGVERWVLEGTDYVYPRTTNKILEQYLKDKGVAAEDIIVNYTPFGFSDWQTEVSRIKEFGSAGKKTAVVSTVNGDVAAARVDAIEEAGFDHVHFAWAGASKPGTGHYYRIQGPTFLVEFVNTQPDAAGNPASHIHLIWRDTAGDFGVPIK